MTAPRPYAVWFFEPNSKIPMVGRSRFATIEAAEKRARSDVALLPEGRAEVWEADAEGNWKQVSVVKRCGDACRAKK